MTLIRLMTNRTSQKTPMNLASLTQNHFRRKSAGDQKKRLWDHAMLDLMYRCRMVMNHCRNGVGYCCFRCRQMMKSLPVKRNPALRVNRGVGRGCCWPDVRRSCLMNRVNRMMTQTNRMGWLDYRNAHSPVGQMKAL